VKFFNMFNVGLVDLILLVYKDGLINAKQHVKTQR